MLIAVFTVPVQAQTTTAKPAAKPMTAAKPTPKPASSPNDELVKLAKAGMSEDILLATVAKTGPSKYNTSADSLVALKDAGVSQRVIAAILGVDVPATGTTSAKSPGGNTTVVTIPPKVETSLGQTSTESTEGRQAGIYAEIDGKLVQLEPAVFQGGQSGNKFLNAMTSLIPGTVKGVVRSAKAHQRLTTGSPVFWFYFENKGAGLSNTGATVFSGYMNGASSPNEFVLARMTSKNNQRELVIGETGAFRDKAGVRNKDIADFDFEKVQTGVYKVTLKSPLSPGEYSFFYGAGSSSMGNGVAKVFDFGID